MSGDGPPIDHAADALCYMMTGMLAGKTEALQRATQEAQARGLSVYRLTSDGAVKLMPLDEFFALLPEDAPA